jgi:putative transposase
MAKIFTAKDKARIALDALKGIETTAQVASIYKAHPVQVGLWKKTLSTHAHTLFDIEHNDAQKIKELEETMSNLYQIIGERDAELVWLKKKFAT